MRSVWASWVAVVALCGPASLARQASGQERSKEPPIEVKVLVLNYDPLVPKDGGGRERLHQALNWNDPRALVDGYVADLGRATGWAVRLEVKEWRDLDLFPRKADGFRYTAESYLQCHHRGKGWHDPDAVDYAAAVAETGADAMVAAGAVDEVWLLGGPYFGYWESAMAGPRSFYINGGPLPGIRCDRPFVVMGFNYERGVAEMLHSLGHRVESTMAHFSGGWEADRLTTDWARFAANAKQSKGEAGCGSCHYPPNAERDYDYANRRPVESTADDWLAYPRLTGRKAPVNCESWGGPDYQRNYFAWWYARLPRAPGVDPKTGMRNNWWEYVYRYDRYREDGRPRD
jgi:hypothetical protein